MMVTIKDNTTGKYVQGWEFKDNVSVNTSREPMQFEEQEAQMFIEQMGDKYSMIEVTT